MYRAPCGGGAEKRAAAARDPSAEHMQIRCGHRTDGVDVLAAEVDSEGEEGAGWFARRRRANGGDALSCSGARTGPGGAMSHKHQACSH